MELNDFIAKMQELIDTASGEPKGGKVVEAKCIAPDVYTCTVISCVNKEGVYSIAYFYLFGKRNIARDKKTAEQFVLKHYDELQKTFSITGTGGHAMTRMPCRRAAVMTAVFEALIRGEDEDVLRNFCRACNNAALYCYDDTVALKLNSHIARMTSNDRKHKIELYDVAKTAINDYCQKEKL